MSEVKKIATRESYGNALVELGLSLIHIWIVFITAIRKMMWRQESISILAITAAK